MGGGGVVSVLAAPEVAGTGLQCQRPCVLAEHSLTERVLQELQRAEKHKAANTRVHRGMCSGGWAGASDKRQQEHGARAEHSSELMYQP